MCKRRPGDDPTIWKVPIARCNLQPTPTRNGPMGSERVRTSRTEIGYQLGTGQHRYSRYIDNSCDNKHCTLKLVWERLHGEIGVSKAAR
jgi:hypothetical protein